MDRDFLLGVLAVQLGQATPQQVMAAAAAHLTDRSRSLSERLLAEGVFTSERYQMLSAMADEAIRANAGDVNATMRALGGEQAVYASFGGSLVVDEAGQVSLAARAEGAESTGDDSLGVEPETPGRYRHEGAELGRGGIGRVLVAFDRFLGREVAVKELLVGGAGSQPTTRRSGAPSHTSAAVARFLREARVTGQLEHPNIVPVYEVGQRATGELYYTMKLVRGRTMADALRQCGTLADRLKLLPHYVDLCDAIAYAHSRGVVHRDIKTANVMLGEFGETVVLDWGLAKARGQSDPRGRELSRELEQMQEAAAGHTVDGSAIGTPAYMSPEQAEGLVDEIDERSDVWSLGAVLYEVLTGRPPFEGVTPYEIIGKVLQGEVEAPARVDEAIPAELSAVAAQALQRDKAARYQLAGDLADEIRAYMTGGRIQAYTYSAWELVRAFVRAHKAVSALAGVIFVLAIVAATMIFQAYRTADRQRDRAEAGERTALVRTAGILREGAKTALEAGRFFEARARIRSSMELSDSASIRALWARVEAESSIGGLAVPGEMQVNALSFSPDGRRLALAGLQGSVQIVDVASGQIEAARSGDVVGTRAIEFSPDGRSVVVARADGRVERWHPATDRVEILPGGEGAVDCVRSSPDGRQLAVGHADGTIRILDASTQQPLRELKGHGHAIRSLAWRADGLEMVSVSGKADSSLRVWDTASGESRQVIPLPAETGWHVVYRPGARQAVTTHRDGSLRLWDLDTGAQLRVFQGPEALVWSAVFTQDGRRLFSGSSEKTIRGWDVETGASLAVLRGDFQDVLDLRISADGRTLAAANCAVSGTPLTLWNLEAVGARGRSGSAKEAGLATNAALLRDGSAALFVDLRGDLWRRDIPSGLSHRLGGVGRPRLLAIGPDPALLATAGYDAVVRLWDLETGREVALLGGHRNDVQSLIFSGNGEWLASAGADHDVRLWDVHEERLARVLRGHTNRVSSVSFSHDDRLVASASNDGSVRIWRVADGEQVQRFDFPSQVSAVRFGGDDTFVLAALWSGAVLRVDLATPTPRPTPLASCEGGAGSMDEAPDGLHFTVACAGPPLIVSAVGEATETVRLPSGSAQLLFVPGGLLTVEGDGALRLRDRASLRPVWRSPLLLDDPPRLYTERGWRGLDGAAWQAPTPAAWRQAVEERGAIGERSPDRRALCLLTFEGALERWDIATDQRAYSQPAGAASQVIALDGGCAILDPKKNLTVFDARGTDVARVAGVSAVEWDRGASSSATGAEGPSRLEGVLAATAQGLIRVDVRGAQQQVASDGADATAVARLGEGFVTGGADGTIRLVAATDGAGFEDVAFEAPPADLTWGASVHWLTQGPMDTVIAAYSSGLVGVWDSRQGELLRSVLLHGAAAFRVVHDQTVAAASDAGATTALDLSVFHRERCDLMRDVWRRVPVVWRDGRPVVEAPPADHPCAAAHDRPKSARQGT